MQFGQPKLNFPGSLNKDYILNVAKEYLKCHEVYLMCHEMPTSWIREANDIIWIYHDL